MNRNEIVKRVVEAINSFPCIDGEWTTQTVEDGRFQIRFRFSRLDADAWETLGIIGYCSAEAEDSAIGPIELRVPLHHTPEWVFFELQGDIDHCSLLSSLLESAISDR